MSNKFLLLCLCLSVALTACKGRKNKHGSPPVVKIDTASVASATATTLLSTTLTKWTYFSAKIDVDFRSDENKISPNVSIRMYKDSLIWLTGGMFGIEGFRMLINKDSVVMMNKLERKYQVFKSNNFSGITDIPLSVTQIQNLILGKPVYALELYSILSRDPAKLGIEYQQEKFTTSHSYQNQFLTIDSTVIRDRIAPNYALALYSSYIDVSGHNFPSVTALRASSGQKRFEIDLKYSDIDFETVLSFPFTIPSSYEKIK